MGEERLKQEIMRNKLWMLIAGIILGLLSAGVILLVSRPPQGAAILLRPPPTQVPLIVYVTGAVSEPGVYSLPINSRVEDAIHKAGGMTKEANSCSLNLAANLQDGSQIHVPLKSEPAILGSGVTFSSGVDKSGEKQLISTTSSYPININTASQIELENLPGIGPVTAQKIIEYRQENEFLIIEDLQKVSGIGPATFEKLKDLITVDGEK